MNKLYDSEYGPVAGGGNKIPTAEDYIKYYYLLDANREKGSSDLLKEFAKLHVEAALKEANRRVQKASQLTSEEAEKVILNAYPLDLIK